MKLTLLSMMVVAIFCSAPVVAAEANTASTVEAVAAAANALIATLDDEQRERLLFSFEDNDQRVNWSNLPVGMVPRGGLRYGNLNATQQQAVMKLLAVTLSPAGLQQMIDNMKGDEYLRVEAEKRPRRGRRRRDPDFGEAAYYISILGTPSTTEPWMWQFGGHHLGVNATVVGNRITLAPSLTGGQPMDFELEGRKYRQLADEEDTAFELIGMLDETQRDQAILSERHVDMIYGPGKEGAQPRQEGIKVTDLNERQQKVLLKLVDARIGILNKVHAKLVMDRIIADLDETWFAWFGPTEPGTATAFRIQGPTILMEYSPQRLGGDLTNHTHAMYRDPTNDYGVRFIKEQ